MRGRLCTVVKIHQLRARFRTSSALRFVCASHSVGANDDYEDDDGSDDACDDASRPRDGFTTIDVRSTSSCSSSSSSCAVIRGPEDTDASSVDAIIIVSGNSSIGINNIIIDWRRTTKTDDDGANASDGGDNRWCDWYGRVGVVRDDGVRVGVRVGVQSGFDETEAGRRRDEGGFRARGELRVVAAHVRPNVRAVWVFALQVLDPGDAEFDDARIARGRIGDG